jgi:hypothetical protein
LNGCLRLGVCFWLVDVCHRLLFSLFYTIRFLTHLAVFRSGLLVVESLFAWFAGSKAAARLRLPGRGFDDPRLPRSTRE